MKVLLTTHQFFPNYSSGTEVLTYTVAMELNKRGHDVRVLTGWPIQPAKESKSLGDEYYYDSLHVYRFFTPLSSKQSQAELRHDNRTADQYFKTILDDFKPDIVHFFHLDRLGTGLIEVACKSRVPAFMTPTDFWAFCPTGQLMLPNYQLCSGPNPCAGNCIQHIASVTQKTLLGYFLGKLPIAFFDKLSKLKINNWVASLQHYKNIKVISSWASINIKRMNMLGKIVSPNLFMSEKLIQQGVEPRLIVESSFGVEMEAIVKKNNRVKNKMINIGYIATIAPHKGCHVLVEAFNGLKQGSARLKIYGKTDNFPSYVSRLKKDVNDNPFVEFCGEFPLEIIGNILNDIDILVVPSLWYENTPLIVYAAQAAGCPIVGSNLPGISSVLHHDSNALLFSPGHVGELQGALEMLINQPDELERLRDNSVEPKSIRAYVDDLLNTWEG